MELLDHAIHRLPKPPILRCARPLRVPLDINRRSASATPEFVCQRELPDSILKSRICVGSGN